MNDSPNLNLLSVARRDDQLTSSKAFSASNESNTVLFLLFNEWDIMLNIQHILLDECLAFIKPVWYGSIVNGVIDFIVVARTLLVIYVWINK